MRPLSFLPGLTALALTAATPIYAGENHALLIGASTYPNLDERFWLVGPANDVDLVRTYLTLNEDVPFDPNNITVLADGVVGSEDPTLANIRTEMAALATRLQPGDFVYLHFSGHGTQAPANVPATELDGLDELFLPTDIGLWSDTVGTVKNALIDDEIGTMIAGLRATGATVWAVFDSCHSGTVTRAASAGDDVRLRKLSPEALGVPNAAIEEAMEGTVTRSVNPRAQDEAPVETSANAIASQGPFIAFYAAQSNESTPEKRLPRGKPGRRSQGVFTFTLFETLASNPGISYRQLGHEILRKYATEGRARSTPMFVGDLDLPVFANGDAQTVFQWPISVASDGTLTLPAGHLHDLETDERLAVLTSPADPISAALGHAVVEKVDNFSAKLGLVTDGASSAGFPDGVPNGAYARRLDKSVAFATTIALPAPSNGQSSTLEQALDFGKQHGLLSDRITFVSSDSPADLRLSYHAETGSIVVSRGDDFVAPSDLIRSPRIRISDKSAEQLALDLTDTFAQISKVQNLLKLGAGLPSSSLDVGVILQSRLSGQPELDALPQVLIPRLVPGDEVHIVAENREITPVDINVLYIGSDYSITHMFKGRLQPGDRLAQGLLRITDDSFGRDRMILILTPASEHTAVEDFGFLAQAEMPALRSTQDSWLSQVLADAGFGSTLRAAVPLGAPPKAAKRPAMLQFELDTRPLK
ncbi:caspase family protein [uncultured Pelagimonas sp.]|uniref:caspase family protein n=1 Tax=uncultured Pelagimonas sp. TaxID=1618102 RepID=UPI002610B58D|nr:caspase family protein [uncultured Pelagimonas sp.]